MKTIEKIEKLELELKELKDSLNKPKLEIGKWYRIDREGYKNFLIHLVGIRNGGNYGFNMSGEWSNILGIASIEYFKLATNKEIEDALIKEAKKRGFKEGVKCNYKLSGFFDKSDHFGNFMLMRDKKELGFGCGFIFKDGVWAEIIEDKKPIINGYEMVVCNNGYIKFGCKSFNITNVFSYYRLCKELYIDSFKIEDTIEDTFVTIKQLKEVVDYLDNN